MIANHISKSQLVTIDYLRTIKTPETKKEVFKQRFFTTFYKTNEATMLL
jgi:hypothetical protein